MLMSSCPGCAMPRSDADIAERPCPLCGYVAGQVVAPYVDEPPPPVVESVAAVAPPTALRKERTAVKLGAAALLSLLAGGVVGKQFAGTKIVESKITVPVEVVRYEKEPAKPAEEPVLPPADATPPRVPEAVVAPPPAPAVQLAGGVSLIRLDRPTDTYTMERIGEGNKIKLVGRVDKLILQGADGGATLDAAELDAKTVTVSGTVEGNAYVRLHAADGAVTFSKAISGGARVEVDAPACLVTFSAGYPPKTHGAPVSGGAKIRVNARSVLFSKKIDGGSTVEVTVGGGGSLKFLELAGGSKLHYRFEKPDDVVKILPGTIDESSECKRLE